MHYVSQCVLVVQIAPGAKPFVSIGIYPQENPILTAFHSSQLGLFNFKEEICHN